MHPRISPSADTSSRHLLALTTVLVLFASSGATCVKPWVAQSPPAPQVLMPGATVDEVITAVHANSARIGSVMTNDATISVGKSMAGIPVPPLIGRIAVQPSRRLRLTAGTRLLGTEVDVGSNDELFWMWIKRNDPPAVYFARHEQFAASPAAQQLGIEPSWLVQALGLVTFGIDEVHNGPIARADGALEIHSTWATPHGQVTRKTVIDASRAWVTQQHVYDASGNLLGSAVARSHRYYPTHQVSLPQVIEIHWPASQLVLTVDMGHVVLNQVSAADATLFQMPPFHREQRIDLGNSVPSMGLSPPTGHSPTAWSVGDANALSAGATTPIGLPTAGRPGVGQP